MSRHEDRLHELYGPPFDGPYADYGTDGRQLRQLAENLDSVRESLVSVLETLAALIGEVDRLAGGVAAVAATARDRHLSRRRE